MADLCTLAEAKIQLRIAADDTAYDTAIQPKIAQASEIILDYLKYQADGTWTAVTVPPSIKAAVLLVLSHLYEHRGDDMAPDEALWLAIERLLMRRRDPALA